LQLLNDRVELICVEHAQQRHLHQRFDDEVMRKELVQWTQQLFESVLSCSTLSRSF
jgi:hypothetical protein